jgi:hypothetical protein
MLRCIAAMWALLSALLATLPIATIERWRWARYTTCIEVLSEVVNPKKRFEPVTKGALSLVAYFKTVFK